MSNYINGSLQGNLSVGQGERGKSLEFIWRGTELGVRVEGQTEYQFTDLGSVDGSGERTQIQMQISEGYIQWKHTYEDEWKNLIALSELKGDKGEQGIPGINGKSAYELWLEQGNEGALEEFLQSLKGEDGKPLVYELVTTPIADSTLNLTTDKYQTTTMENNTTMTLPTVESFTEIHLFFDTTEALTLIFPSAKWQTQPSIEANKTYEFIFTYVNNTWLGGCIVYE